MELKKTHKRSEGIACIYAHAERQGDNFTCNLCFNTHQKSAFQQFKLKYAPVLIWQKHIPNLTTSDHKVCLRLQAVSVTKEIKN